MKKKPTLVLYHPLMAVEGYPVLAGRVQPAFEYLRDTGTLESPQVIVEEAPRVGEDLLLQVHTPGHIQHVKGSGYDSASLVSGGSAVRAGEAVWVGEAANAFAFTGCAGHHASRDSSWGFCYYNNSALLIRHLQKVHGVNRFFIVDTDPHPGDGTRDILGNDEEVYHLNFEASFRESLDTVTQRHVDVPFPSSSSDDSFVEAVRLLALPLARRIRPEIIFWNMGHDAHALDYGGFNLSLRAFPAMTEILLQAADEVCEGRLVVLLSGGSEVSVAKHAISGIVRKLAGLPQLPEDVQDEPTTESAATKRMAEEIIMKVRSKLGLDEPS
ncbi:MAG: histone deacetylase [Promethearchaeota archaeon]